MLGVVMFGKVSYSLFKVLSGQVWNGAVWFGTVRQGIIFTVRFGWGRWGIVMFCEVRNHIHCYVR